MYCVNDCKTVIFLKLSVCVDSLYLFSAHLLCCASCTNKDIHLYNKPRYAKLSCEHIAVLQCERHELSVLFLVKY